VGLSWSGDDAFSKVPGQDPAVLWRGWKPTGVTRAQASDLWLGSASIHEKENIKVNYYFQVFTWQGNSPYAIRAA
jgi:hypothetical protein